ncbi:single-stranded DNA-binding protein [Paenochrobactrum sp. BZR 588]|uniref:single-stranded DNA-binding protein n=1 Tax=Paenochrobactrum TaxID=999488 RepID=UPI0035BC3A57
MGADPEIRWSNGGDPIVNMRIATSESWRDRQSGERREKREWHIVVIFNEHLAKVAEQYIKKGTQVYLEGALQTRKWKDRDGNDQYSTEIVLQMIGERGSNDDAERGRAEQRSNQQSRQSYGDQSGGSSSRDLDDEIPF